MNHETVEKREVVFMYDPSDPPAWARRDGIMPATPPPTAKPGRNNASEAKAMLIGVYAGGILAFIIVMVVIYFRGVPAADDTSANTTQTIVVCNQPSVDQTEQNSVSANDWFNLTGHYPPAAGVYNVVRDGFTKQVASIELIRPASEVNC